MINPNSRVFDDYTLSEKIACILLLTLVVAAPIPYGGVTQLGVLIIDVLAFAIATLVLIGKPRALGPASVPAIAIAAIAAIGLLQLVPLAPGIIRTVSPTTASINGDTNALLRLFGKPGVTERLSIAPTETVRALLLIAAYVALFIAAHSLGRTRAQRRLVLVTLLLAAVIHIGYAALTQNERTAEQVTDRMHGLFINANHFAGYLEIALMLAFGFIWIEVLTGSDRLPLKIERGAALEKRLVPLAVRGLAWVVIAAAIGFSKSRMGIAAAGLTLIIMTAFALLHRRSSRHRARNAAFAGGVLVAAVLLVATITRDVPLVRFLAADPRDPETDIRPRIWRSSIDAWEQFPHLGSGLGTFREAFRRVQPRDLPGLFEQAHNDSLQLLVTGGWISLALAVFAFAFLFAVFIRAWSRQRHREESVIALASMAALFSLLVHGIAEFNFSIPAIPATLAIVLGVGWAAANDEREAA